MGALTDPERISRWFLPISGDFRLGGRYQPEGKPATTAFDTTMPEARRDWQPAP